MCEVAKCKQTLPQNRTGRNGHFPNVESVSKSGLQKVRTSTTVQPESISRKDMRIRYLPPTSPNRFVEDYRYKVHKSE